MRRHAEASMFDLGQLRCFIAVRRTREIDFMMRRFPIGRALQ
jgi:hypothetical protein